MRLNRLQSPFFFVLFFILSPFMGQIGAEEPVEFFYFNPDSVQSNFSKLKKEVDRFFQVSGHGARFQAFSQQADFDRLVKTRRPALVLVPAWYYEQYGQDGSLIPLLTPLKNGKPSYRKVLLVRAGSRDGGKLRGKTLAVTNMGPKTDEELDRFFNNGHVYDFANTNIITTPKDADALYALALGQVDAAVVGMDTVREVGAANRRILEVIEEVAPSKPVPMPILCVMQGRMNNEEIERLRGIFLEDGCRQPLPLFMDMLQFHGWQNAML